MGDKKEKKRKYNEDEEVEKVEKKAKKKSKESEPVVEEKKKKKSKTDENEEEKPKKTKKSKEIEAPVVEEQKKPKKKKAEREENSYERPGTTVEGTLLCNFTMSEEQSNPGSKREDKTAPSTANHRKDTYELWKNGEEAWKNNSLDPTYLATNPDKITRIFCGNLNKNITEEQLHEAFPGISYIKWICDKTTGEFYGTTFLEMSDAKSAANAVMKDRTKLLGRPLKIYYCPPKPGDIWPPVQRERSNANNKGANNLQEREKTPKPPNGCKIFMGNLSYSIDDDTVVKFFEDCGEMVGLRWLTHKDSGQFKGCGYAEFATTEAADQAILKDGQMLLGRPIRLDWG